MPEDSERQETVHGESSTGAGGPETNLHSDAKYGPLSRLWSGLFKDAKAPVIVVFFTLIISAASLYYTHRQQSDAGDQYRKSQEQTLLSLVVSISQEQRDTVQSDLRALADGLEANTIIGQLPQSDVPSVEKYQVGVALEAGDDFGPALKLLQEAGAEASDPVTAADSWRAAAYVLNEIGRNGESENDITKARQAINARNATRAAADGNIAFTDYYDITIRTSIRPVSSSNCKIVRNDWDDAQPVMGDIQVHYGISNALQAEVEAAVGAANKYCHALLPNPPQPS